MLSSGVVVERSRFGGSSSAGSEFLCCRRVDVGLEGVWWDVFWRSVFGVANGDVGAEVGCWVFVEVLVAVVPVEEKEVVWSMDGGSCNGNP